MLQILFDVFSSTPSSRFVRQFDDGSEGVGVDFGPCGRSDHFLVGIGASRMDLSTQAPGIFARLELWVSPQVTAGVIDAIVFGASTSGDGCVEVITRGELGYDLAADLRSFVASQIDFKAFLVRRLEEERRRPEIAQAIRRARRI